MEKAYNQPNIIQELIAELAKRDVGYAILRNYHSFPNIPTNTDLDILISPHDISRFRAVIRDLMGPEKAWILKQERRANVFSFLFYDRSASVPFWVDAFNGILAKGVVWSDGEELLKNRIKTKEGFYILTPEAEAAILMLKEGLAGRPVKKKYRKKIQDISRQNEDAFFAVVAKYSGESQAKEIIAIAQAGDWEKALKRGPAWRRKILHRNMKQRPFQQLRFLCAFVFWYLWGAIRIQRGLVVVFLGPDGVGKTTLSQKLTSEFRGKPFGFRRVVLRHGQMGLFPELGNLVVAVRTRLFRRSFSKSREQSHREVGSLRALVHLFYYGLELFLAWPLIWWGRYRGWVFIFDRYFYDFAVTKKYTGFFFLLTKFIPQPDAMFLLKASPEVIRKRKEELDIAEIQDYLDVFGGTRFANAYKPILLDAERPTDELLKEAEIVIARNLYI